MAARYGLKPPFALLAPGASPTGDVKRWPVERYAALAASAAGEELMVAVLGGAAEEPVAKRIGDVAPGAFDLTSRTRMVDVAGLAAEAALMVGNDTGPTPLGGPMPGRRG